MPASKPTLGTAILQVMEAVAYVQKTGRMSAGPARYSFASEADIIRALRPAMVEAGLALIPVAVDASTVQHGATRSGTMQHRVDAVFTYHLLHGPSGEHQVVCALGCGTDVGDKAAGKASTSAYKYALRECFGLETGDDPDEHPSSDQGVSATGHDPEWADERQRFCAKLTELGVSYDKVRDYLVERGDGKPSSWGSKGRVAFMRALLAGQEPALWQPEPGSQG